MFNFNRVVFGWVFGASHRYVLVDAAGIFLAAYLPYFIGLAAAIFLFLRQQVRQRILFGCEALLAVIVSRGLVTAAMRFFWYNPRPAEVLSLKALIAESGSSMPSGHAAFFFALAYVIFLHDRRWGGVFLGLALANGIARVFTGVHWPLDIVWGAAVGIGSALAVHALVKPLLKDLHANHTAEETNG